MDALAEKLHAIVERCRSIAEDPEFKRNAERIARENADAADVLAASELRHARLRSGVPVGLWNPVHPEKSPLENTKPTPALDAVRGHLVSPAECVFLTLSGKRGQGKTFASAFAVYEKGGRFVDAHDLVRLSSFDQGEWFDLERQPLLAIDELGAEYLNDAYKANLYALLNRRYADQRKTILATNLSAPAFVARYCPDPEDRLLERLTKGGRWVNLDGESMRRPWSETEKEDA